MCKEFPQVVGVIDQEIYEAGRHFVLRVVTDEGYLMRTGQCYMQDLLIGT